MTEDRKREYSFVRTVQFRTFFVAVLLVNLFSACKKESAETIEPYQTEPGDIADIPRTDPSLSPVDGSDTVASPPSSDLQAGIFNKDSKGFARAIGKAPLGLDISLARDNAAASARGNLLKFLKESGYVLDPPDTLQGATIERYWKKGKYIYAVSIVPLVALSPTMNDSGALSSKEAANREATTNTENEQSEGDSPTGGSVP